VKPAEQKHLDTSGADDLGTVVDVCLIVAGIAQTSNWSFGHTS
jgi:hypothetical protein